MNHENPFSPPTARVDDHTDGQPADIDSLPVSERWKAKFKLFERAGAPGFANLKNLPPDERKRATVGINVLAFLFGPFYYLAKGMWRKALTLFLACLLAVIALEAVFELLGYSQFGKALGYGIAAVFAIRANIDYYKKMVLGDNGWW
jgi:hypothetical protein